MSAQTFNIPFHSLGQLWYPIFKHLLSEFCVIIEIIIKKLELWGLCFVVGMYNSRTVELNYLTSSMKLTAQP